jgi:hypothetical protein
MQTFQRETLNPKAWLFTIHGEPQVYYGNALSIMEMQNTIDYLAKYYDAVLIREPFDYYNLTKMKKLYNAKNFNSR